MPRFFLPADALRGDAPVLTGDEAHHCLNVLRRGPGDRITLFDGAGHAAEAEIVSATKREATLRVLSRQAAEPLPCRLRLAQAVPKGKNMDLILEKAVELGAAEILPLLTERTVVQLDAREAAAKQAKWQTIALEACKQCGQNWLPRVAAPVPLRAFLDSAPLDAGIAVIGSLQPGARHIHDVLADRPERPREATVFIGPEGDFSPAEIDLILAHGAQPITFGPIILRTETAAIYSLSVLAHELF